ncbi:MAG: hypothetical protein NDJ90_07335 [Oligoflexia bacterium]|nr:hypothetical protein [Oligoflexia bacterium]
MSIITWRTGTLLCTTALAAALVGCSATVTTTAPDTTTPTTPTTPTNMSISGQIAGSGSGLRMASMRQSSIDSFLRIDNPYSSQAVTLEDLLVSCVTFTVPPVAGSGGTVGADGRFTVTFPGTALNKNFGCFVSSITDTFDPIPMVFVDETKRAMNGDASKNSRIAVQDSINLPAIELNLDTKEATVDVATIESTTNTGATGEEVLAAPTGTKIDFTGDWSISLPSASGITMPAGYVAPCTPADVIAAEASGNKSACNGPIVGMRLYMQRMTGKVFTPTNVTACDTARNTGGSNPADLLAGACAGSTGTEDAYGIMMWTGDLDNVFGEGPAPTAEELAAILAGVDPQSSFNACGRKMGFTNTEAKVFGGVDLSLDPNYVASGSSATSNGKFYEGNYAFATSIDLSGTPETQAVYASNAGPGKPLQDVGNDQISLITDGWKVEEAQQAWSMGDCEQAWVTVGTRQVSVWRCYGKYDASGTSNWAAAVPVRQDNFGHGCYLESDATKAPLNFSNHNEYWNWGQAGEPTYVALTHYGDTPLAGTGYNGNKYTKLNFMPKNQDNQNMLEAPATVICENFGGMFNEDGSQFTGNGDATHVQWNSFASQNALCSELYTNAGTSQTKKVIALQCYANAYWQLKDLIKTYGKAGGVTTSCIREANFDYSATNEWDFFHQDGPAKAKGQVIFELFNYASNDSGSFTFEEVYGESFSSGNGGSSWTNCRVRSVETITITSISANKLLAEMTSFKNLIDTGNAVCVAEAQEGGRLDVGVKKSLFVLDRH